MLSWASYLFGSSSVEDVQKDDQNVVAMDTGANAETEWVVVDHSGNNDETPRVAVTDLENLLIEHPSMSVYKKNGSDGESNASDSSLAVACKSKRSHPGSARQMPKRTRLVSARAEVIAEVTQVKQAQKVQEKRLQKSNNRKGLDRLNKVANCDIKNSRKSRQRNPSGRMNGRVPQRKQ